VMQSSPTTTQILEGLRVELRESLMPEISAAPVRIAVEMLDNVLSNLATRSAHEIAWMRDECAQIEALVEDINEPTVTAALVDYRALDRESLHLGDVQAAYDRASEVLSCVIEHALASENRALLDAARAVLRLRSDREMTILGGWNVAGRQ
jgi:hypothetical protein